MKNWHEHDLTLIFGLRGGKLRAEGQWSNDFIRWAADKKQFFEGNIDIPEWKTSTKMFMLGKGKDPVEGKEEMMNLEAKVSHLFLLLLASAYQACI